MKADLSFTGLSSAVFGRPGRVLPPSPAVVVARMKVLYIIIVFRVRNGNVVEFYDKTEADNQSASFR